MWAGGCNWQNWALQSQKLQSMNHDQVDWATLAKQWIQMKDTVPSDASVAPTTCAAETTFVTTANLAAPPPPPPPPMPTSEDLSIPPPPGTTVSDEHEDGGEMDMEIEDDTTVVTPTQVVSNMQPNHHNGAPFNGGWALGASNENWGWNNTSSHEHNNWGWGADAAVRGECWSVEGSTYPTEGYLWGDGVGEHHMVPAITTDYEHGVRHSRSSSSSSRARMDYGMRDIPEKEADFQLDAAQRKKLPLWIREGLEKMEREKQKKLEREKAASEKEAMLKHKREAAERRLAEHPDGAMIQPAKSKFDSDSEEEENDTKEPKKEKTSEESLSSAAGHQ
ncbi:arginine/serine-rich protein PNISR, partial [Hyalella azteca]|uniref:Arginine/serine-rich protein PNISR n=1 Tax=Hyalella azteca TaxID=294128 RepID=A0A8B7PA53_HYAAZ